MNLAIDIGNTAVKWALFDGKKMVEHGHATPDGAGKALASMCDKAAHAMICASGDATAVVDILGQRGVDYVTLSSAMPLPIQLGYKTPATLGADRVAAACGAWTMHPAEATLVIDAGTCITVDYIDAEGVYHGGAIMPGLGMSLRALHEYTDKLPLVDADSAVTARIPGRTTEESIIAGTLGATMLALAGYVTLYRQRSPQLNIMITGGDAARLVKAGVSGWEEVPLLTLHGMNAIMEHNEQ